jgi:hypothetical protein
MQGNTRLAFGAMSNIQKCKTVKDFAKNVKSKT